MNIVKLAAIAGVLASWPMASDASGFAYQDRSRTGTVALDAGLGFTLDPDTFLMAFKGDYFVLHNVALSPVLQMGVSDDIFLLAPTFDVRGVFDLPGGGAVSRIKPSIHGGAGFVYANVDRGPVSDANDVGFLIHMGFGCDFYLTTRFALGTHLWFNIVPTEIFNDRFFFSWSFLNAKFHF